MNDNETQEIKDPREIGTKGLSGISSSSRGERPDGLYFGRTAKEYRAIQNLRNELASPVEYLGDVYQDAGNSQYDTKVASLTDLENLQEFRAQVQPWYDQIANGALKMVTTAATTFIDGTLGSLMGLATGIYNMASGDPETDFWKGMWNNAITNRMADINDKMEEVAHNYRSEWEENASVFERMFSAKGAANFWGDDILKNAGFTVGAAASIWATGGIEGALKGISSLGKLGSKIGLLTRGINGALESTKAGKVASWLTKTFVSTQGEASIEALNSTRESLKALDAEIAAMSEKGYRDAALEYEQDIASGVSELEARAAYENKINTLESELANYKENVENELGDAANIIYAANIAALSVSNNLTLGSMIRGGYNNSKSLLSQALKTSGGKPIESAEEAGKALLKGTLRFEAPKVDNAIAKTIGHWALTSTQEGLEEGVQNLASNTGQIVAAAKGHKWAKDSTSMLGNLIDSDADEDMATYSKALGKAFEDQFGKLNSPGWTEVVAGFLTGALGVASVHRNEQGNIRPTWQGGLKESWETVNGNRDAVAKVADRVNQALSSNKFSERAKHAVEQIAIKKEQDKALERDDINAYKNLEVQQLMSDAIFFRDMGMLDDYLAMYKEMANGLSDEDLTELKAAAKGENGEKSAIELKPDDEIRQLYQDKAKSTLDKINNALKTYDQIEKRYGDNFSEETRREALLEMSYLNALYWDTIRRADEVQTEIDSLNEQEERTPLEELTLLQKTRAKKQLEQQRDELRKTLNEYRNSPSKLQAKVEARQLNRQKEELYKQADKAIQKYKEATTLQDAIDVYTHSAEDTRDKVLDQAIEQAEGETKTKLQQLRSFMGDVSSLEHLIQDKFSSEDDDEVLVNKTIQFREMLQSIVDEMLADSSPVLTRESLKDKLKARVADLQQALNDVLEEAHGVAIAEDGSFDFSVASKEGLVDDSDFEEVLDDETGESHIEMKEGSDAEKYAYAAEIAGRYKDLLDDMNYFVDSLDKLDELKEAGKKKEKEKVDRRKGEKELKEETKKRGGSHVEVEEEIIEGDEDSEEEESYGEEEEDEGDAEEEITEKEAPAKTPPVKNLLTEEEQRYYKVKSKTKGSGATYNMLEKIAESPKKLKDALAKKMNLVKEKLLHLEKKFNEATDDSDKQVIIEKILKVLQDNVVDHRTADTIEALLSKNKRYLKPTSGKEAALPVHDNATQQSLADSEISMNGTQHPAYVSSELTKEGKMVKVTYQKSGATPVQVWLEEQGFNVQEIIDNYLGEIIERDRSKKVQDKTPIHYLHTKEQPDVVFLGMEYAKVEDIIPRDKAKKVIKAQDGKTYILVGEFGWDGARPGTKQMYETVLDSFDGNEYTSEGWTVNTENTNRIKDIEAGYTVKQALGDTSSSVGPRDLEELLHPTSGNPNRNPRHLELEDLSWTVIEGEEGATTRKVINGNPSKVYGIKDAKPGQVYLNIPASNGNFIPIYMETMNLSELQEGTPLYEEIQRLVYIIADRNSTMQDKKSAIINLKDLLIFVKKVSQIHVNDEDSKYAPNTVVITNAAIDSSPRVVIDFNDGEGLDGEELLQEIIKLNPRINLSTTVLERDPSIYLESGVLKTDIGLLGTVNSRFFTYPVDSDGNYVENKPFSGTGKVYSSPVKNRLYIGGKYVYYDGNKFTDANGDAIEDPEGTLEAALKIKTGKIKPTTLNKIAYYVVDDTVYVDNGHGGLTIVGEELAEKVLEVANKKSSNTKKKEAIKKEAAKVKKKNEEAPVDDKKLKARTPDVDEEGEDGKEEDKSATDTMAIEEIEVPTTTGGTRTAKVQRVKYSDIKKGDTVWYSGPNTSSPINKVLIEGIDNGEAYSLSGFIPKDRTYYKEVEQPSADSSSGKSNFSNGTDINNVKSQAEIEAEAASNSFANVLRKRENGAKLRELFSLIDSKLGVKVNNAQAALDELSKPEYQLDLTSEDIQTVIDQLTCYKKG